MIVDDHRLFAEALAYGLRAEGIAAELANGSNAEAALDRARRFSPSVALFEFPGDGVEAGLALVGSLSDRGCKVIMLTGVVDPVHLAACVKEGAIGILYKTISFENLLVAIEEAARLGTLLSPSELYALEDELRLYRAQVKARRKPFERLTRREQEVLAALADGKRATEIAGEFCVSVATVRSQIRSVL
ncbi:MAG: response regulator, partial [Acidimicrobiia bacterium]